MRVLVLGASGKTGSAVTRALVRRGVLVRAAIRPGSAHERVCRAAGAAEVVGVDLKSDDGLAEAVAGVDAIYHLAPNVHPDEIGMARRVVEAARDAGVGRFAFHSVLHPDDSSMAHHVRKHVAEQAVRDIIPAAAVLRPAAYQDNLVPAVLAGEVVVPYSLDTPFTNVALVDVAEAAAIVLTGAGSAGTTYELVGPQSLSVREMAEIAGVPARRTSVEAWVAGPGARVPRPGRDDLIAMFEAYDSVGLAGESPDLERLLGRPATTWAQTVALAR